MDEDKQIDRTKVTFSQAEGLEPLPEPLNLGELSQEARAMLWLLVYGELSENSEHVYMSRRKEIKKGWFSILYNWHVFVEHKPADEFTDDFDHHTRKFKYLINKGQYNEIFDFLQYVMRHQNRPNKFSRTVNMIFQKAKVAYTIIDDGPTIVPAATPEEGAAIGKAMQTLVGSGFHGARVHLVKSGEELNAGRYADSVRESIHAVESVARRLNEDASTTLKPALVELAKHTTIHPALKAGFEKIYGYTNDEGGVRHALHENKANVDQEDAVFMLGACASFVTYLVGKARASGLIES